MTKLKMLLIFGLVSSASYCQTNINYSSFDAWKQNSSTKKKEHIKTIYKSGYIQIDNKRATAIIYNSELNQKELFQFTSFRKVENGHYVGFGKVDNQQMLTFIPEDNHLLLKVNDIIVMQFSLKQSDILKLKKEFGSNIIHANTNYNEDSVTFYVENKSNKNSPKTFINKTERMFNDYLPNLLKSKGEYSSIYNQETHIGDFNGDGIEDVIIWFVYGYGGTAIGGVEAAFYENQNGKPIVVAGFEPNYRFNIDNISNGVVYCTKRLFAKDDINCCPSIEIQIELIYDNKTLTVFEK